MSISLKNLATLIAVSCISVHANSNIIEVVTETTAGIYIDRSAFGQDPIVSTFSGNQISEDIGSSGFGSAAALDSITRADDKIEWQNGNISYGDGITSTSRTVVDIFFQNDTDVDVLPVFTSQILAGGLGMISTGCTGTDLRECGTGNDFPTLLNGGNGVTENGVIASSSFDFQIFSGDTILMSLSGGVSLTRSEVNQFTTDFSDIEGFLNNFRQSSADGDSREKTFDWDLTDIEITMPEVLMLAPGEIGNITYVTEVTTTSNSFCLLIEADTDTTDCTLSYGSFGDPVGRGGGSNPRVGFVDADIFEFDLPTFNNGILDFTLTNEPGPITGVNTPNSLVLAGLSFALLTFRLKRTQ